MGGLGREGDTPVLAPQNPEEAAAMLTDIAREGGSVLPVGGGTKAGWGAGGGGLGEGGGEEVMPIHRISSARMSGLLEHNEGDFTAVMEAGLRLADAQATFARAGQMLAWDPPLANGSAAPPEATIGGIMASADSGPLRHRYGGVRDTVIGATIVFSDGLVATSGGKVIKNVAGYDLAKLFAGSFGTLGFITSVVVRLHPALPESVTVAVPQSSPGRLVEMALGVSRRSLELDGLDIRWEAGRGELLLRLSGATARDRAGLLAADLGAPATEVVESDEEIWQRQRYAQRSSAGAVLKVSSLPSRLERVIAVAEECDAGLVARAALGLSWLNFAAGDDLPERVGRAVSALAPECHVVPLDGAERAGASWPALEPNLAELSGRLIRRLDPAGMFRPNAMAGVGR